jgi:hypothetical protein
MDRRTLIVSGLMTFGAAGLARAQALPQGRPPGSMPAEPAGEPLEGSFDTPAPAQAAPAPAAASAPGGQPAYPSAGPSTYSQDEIVQNASNFLGVTAEAAGGAVEKLFANNDRPTAYIAGEEGSGALIFGARYGRGLLYMKEREPVEVYWQGPSAGWDWGGNASRVFVLCYGLVEPNAIFQRFPGVEGSAYLVGGLGVNYQRAEAITLAPIRAGVGLRLGANIGYLAYTRKRNYIPF